VLYLLAVCQKYEMVSVQSSIRAEVSRGASPVPKGAEAFRAYAIASAKGLIPETENAARLTLDHPMTFEILGEGLRLFEGWALRDLVNFRRRCRDNLVTCLNSFLERSPGDWVHCALGSLNKLFTQNKNNLKLEIHTRPLDIHSKIRQEYLTACQVHVYCKSCLRAYAKDGSIFCAGLETELVKARDKVTYFLYL
jgi:hypothetical protein